MSEPTPVSPVAPVQPQGGLGQGLVNLTETAAGKSGAKGIAFPVYLILAAIIALGIAILGFLLVRARRKAAILEFQLKEKEEEIKDLVDRQKLEQNEQVRKDAEGQVIVLTAGVAELKKAVAASEDEAVKRTEVFAKLVSWNDVVVVDKRKP